MKKFLKVLGYLLAAVVVIAGGAVTYLFARKPDMAPPATVKIEPTAERVARGKYLATLADCDGCHSDRDFTRFGGPLSAYVSIALGMLVWAIARYGFQAQAPYLLGLVTALVGYVAAAAVAPSSRS